MLKILPIFAVTCSARNNLIKSTFRNFSKTVYKSKTNICCNFTGNKYLLQQAIIFNATQRYWLSKQSNTALTKDAPSISDSFLKGVPDIDDSERKEEVLNIVKLLLSHGCSEEEIKTKCLPCIISTQSSYSKVKLLTELHSNTIMLMPLLSCHIASLRTAVKRCQQDNNITGFPNRLEYLSHNLEISLYDLMPMISKHSSLLTMPFQRLKNKMNILKDAQISSEYIVKDLWIFNYNEKLLEKRCFAACESNVELKPWMLRCSEKFFDSMLSKWVQTQDILKGDDELIYLAKKLECSEKYVKVLFEKNKLLKTINIPKIEQVLNFLIEKGYKIAEIRLFPRVFCSSVQSLSTRFDDLQEDKNQITLPTLSQLCASTKVFEKSQRKKRSSNNKETELQESN